MSYAKNILIALDRTCNTLIGGSPEETISSRFGRAILRNECIVCKWVCAILDLFEHQHCIKSIEPNPQTHREVVHFSDKP